MQTSVEKLDELYKNTEELYKSLKEIRMLLDNVNDKSLSMKSISDRMKKSNDLYKTFINKLNK
ncbi:hypothetical protein A0H76_2352 [Hepatospora eriocheir]|uniref:Uncharacterized protein n=1 Tax=Hepatospora eriocheir TaxID=1081669 RepID=A0A1X0QFF7_9MICR|nr:hypothetical protein A0H76_2352 [Hepatospora eriocheir]